MHKNIGPALRNTKTLIHVREELIKLFKITRKEMRVAKIGYVAGIINSDGQDLVERNRKRLIENAEKLRKIHNFPMFTAIDVFPPEIYNNLEEWKLSFEEREEKARLFWREILKSGCVTDIFMTPRWNRSKGATDEHKTAKEIGLTIHYIQPGH